MLVEGFYRHFRMAEHAPPANPLHLWAALAAHGTKGGRTENGMGGIGDYTMEEEGIRGDRGGGGG